MGRLLERFNLVWIEELLDAYDADGHAQLARSLDTPIATGEMLASVAEHVRLIEAEAADIIQPDAPRIGGITQFLKLAALAEASTSSWHRTSRWKSTCTWPPPIRSNPGLNTSTGWTRCSTSGWRSGGRMHVSSRPGLGFTLSDQAHAWTVGTATFGS